MRRQLLVVALALAAPTSAGAAPASVQTQLSPRDPQFGDAVVATVDVAVPPGVDPSSVRIAADFGPYELLSRTRTETSGGIEVKSRLRCLDLPCVPREQVKPFRFKPLRVSYGHTSVVRAWPVLRVHSRVTKADDAAPLLRIPPPTAAPDDSRLPAGATGYALLVLAGLLAVGGAALLLAVALRKVSPARRRVPPLDLALAELAASSANGDSGRRRRALEVLAQELKPLDESLSAESRVLAWGPEEPRPEAISDLTARVRTEVRA